MRSEKFLEEGQCEIVVVGCLNLRWTLLTNFIPQLSQNLLTIITKKITLSAQEIGEWKSQDNLVIGLKTHHLNEITCLFIICLTE